MFTRLFDGLYVRSILMSFVSIGLVACGGDTGGEKSPSPAPSSSAIFSSIPSSSASSTFIPSSSLRSLSSNSSLNVEVVCETPYGPSISVTGSCSSRSSMPGSLSAGSSRSASAISVNLIGGAIQDKPLNLNSVVSTFAGVAKFRGADGIGAAANFEQPTAIVRSGEYLFVADTANHTIRRIVLATGAVETLAGASGLNGSADGFGVTARFSSPAGITTDGTNLYVSDTGNNTIRKIVIASGVVSTLVGTPGTWGSTDGVLAAARFNSPTGIATDGTTLYVADVNNNKIRSVVIATGAVSTFAGSGDWGNSDGVGVLASFKMPSGIVTDGTNLYVADTHNNTIRKIVIATGAVTLLAGDAKAGHGYATDNAKDGVGASAIFYYPSSLTIEGGNLYVADTFSNSIRRVDTTTGNVTTIAGKVFVWVIVEQVDNSSGSEDGVGVKARFSRPMGITSDGANLYVSDTGNSTVRKIALTDSAVTTFAGEVGVPNYAESTAAEANFYGPVDITTDGTYLYVADAKGKGLRKIVIATGAVTTIYHSLFGLAADTHITTDGVNLYVASAEWNTIFKIDLATGKSTAVAGGYRVCYDCAFPTPNSTDGFGEKSNFYHPGGITIIGSSLYVADTYNNTIRKVAMNGDKSMVTTLAGTAGVYGSSDGVGANAFFNGPRGITTDGINLYVTEYNHTIRRIVAATGEVTTLAGKAGNSGNSDGIGAAARFSSPDGITTDGTHLYVSDSSNNTLRKIVIATGEVTTLAGAVAIPGNTDGTGVSARFDTPRGITTDGTSLYLTDSYNNTIRKIQ